MLVELRKQSAPGGIGECGEGTVERAMLILNHMVKCIPAWGVCQSMW
jgi:hypothetical protein